MACHAKVRPEKKHPGRGIGRGVSSTPIGKNRAGRILGAAPAGRARAGQRLKPLRIQSTLFMPSGGLIWSGV